MSQPVATARVVTPTSGLPCASRCTLIKHQKRDVFYPHDAARTSHTTIRSSIPISVSVGIRTAENETRAVRRREPASARRAHYYCNCDNNNNRRRGALALVCILMTRRPRRPRARAGTPRRLTNLRQAMYPHTYNKTAQSDVQRRSKILREAPVNAFGITAPPSPAPGQSSRYDRYAPHWPHAR
ncbi:hypothetical protein EVAR_65335_1 [Eumeta japonica]|uniref:Uncharacterized protein n=1 Tax=Eumeta variegata TaxID=151549 RepID=A0A4C1YWU7_EUMVA|nr:hypothetical protein EVAR_65335_1 [Eumeta japonica]